MGRVSSSNITLIGSHRMWIVVAKPANGRVLPAGDWRHQFSLTAQLPQRATWSSCRASSPQPDQAPRPTTIARHLDTLRSKPGQKWRGPSKNSAAQDPDCPQSHPNPSTRDNATVQGSRRTCSDLIHHVGLLPWTRSLRAHRWLWSCSRPVGPNSTRAISNPAGAAPKCRYWSAIDDKGRGPIEAGSIWGGPLGPLLSP